MSAARFLVHGKVQGVWFRAATREQAQALRLVGQARNLPDGSVEVLAYGSAEAIEKLEALAGRGTAAGESRRGGSPATFRLRIRPANSPPAEC